MCHSPRLGRLLPPFTLKHTYRRHRVNSHHSRPPALSQTLFCRASRPIHIHPSTHPQYPPLYTHLTTIFAIIVIDICGARYLTTFQLLPSITSHKTAPTRPRRSHLSTPQYTVPPQDHLLPHPAPQSDILPSRPITIAQPRLTLHPR